MGIWDISSPLYEKRFTYYDYDGDDLSLSINSAIVGQIDTKKDEEIDWKSIKVSPIQHITH